jgi:eukaryotic-like serine/threonine-protein kinase
MGVVYLAEHPIIGRKVAIKLLHVSFAKDADIVARFFNEARAIHLIGHENIVEILDFGQTPDGQPYFTMEYLNGEPLADLMSRGPVPVPHTVNIAAQICNAVQAAHDKNVVHRDLKPHNVHLLPAGAPPAQPVVKILDFGVAKMTGWDSATSGAQSVKTRTGSLMGTPLYMSPEQCRGSGKLDHRTDIYSLGVILFEMIAGRPPFTAEGVGELFAKHMLEPAPSVLEIAPQTPGHVAHAIARALAKDLDDRYPTMNAFRDALTGVAPVTTAHKMRRPVSHPTALSRSMPGETISQIPVEQSTTLSSAVSELEDELAGASRRGRKRLVLGLVAALAAVLLVVGFAQRKRLFKTPDPVVETAKDPPPVPEPQMVNLRFEAEPAGTHVVRKIDGKDLGTVPLDIQLPKGDDQPEYVLQADGYKDRVVSVDLGRDQTVRLALERQPPIPPVGDDGADKDGKDGRDGKTGKAGIDKNRPRQPGRPRQPRRPAVHDEDGLAVPSF